MTSNEPASDDPGRCPLCGEPNHCALCSLTPRKGPCWCFSLEIPDALLARVPDDQRNQACICRRCVEAFDTQRAAPQFKG